MATVTFKDSTNTSKIFLDGEPYGRIKKIIKDGREVWRIYKKEEDGNQAKLQDQPDRDQAKSRVVSHLNLI